MGIKTKLKKTNWQYASVVGVLKNEKYTGNAILQKTFINNFLTKEVKENKGEIPMYYVENSHPSIISLQTYELANHRLKNKIKATKCSQREFAGHIFCGYCGAMFGSKVWHSNDEYRRIIWQCNDKYKKENVCNSTSIDDNEISKKVLNAVNDMIENRNDIMYELQQQLSTIDTHDLELKKAQIFAELRLIIDKLKSPEFYQDTDIEKNYYDLKLQYDEIEKSVMAFNDKIYKIKQFIKSLENTSCKFEKITPTIFDKFVDRIIVKSKEDIQIVFKNQI